jgi:hypothetical protein
MSAMKIHRTHQSSGAVGAPRRATTEGLARRSRPMPRSTTRVIWTMSQGTVVEFGEIA